MAIVKEEQMKEKEKKESPGRCDNLSTDKRWSCVTRAPLIYFIRS